MNKPELPRWLTIAFFVVGVALIFSCVAFGQLCTDWTLFETVCPAGFEAVCTTKNLPLSGAEYDQNVINSMRACDAGACGGGDDKDVQFNDAGFCGGEDDLEWDKTANELIIGRITNTSQIKLPIYAPGFSDEPTIGFGSATDAYDTGIYSPDEGEIFITAKEDIDLEDLTLSLDVDAECSGEMELFSSCVSDPLLFSGHSVFSVANTKSETNPDGGDAFKVSSSGSGASGSLTTIYYELRLHPTDSQGSCVSSADEGMLYWDDSETALKYCDGVSGWQGFGGTGDITDVWGCSSGNCDDLIAAAGDTLDATGADSTAPNKSGTSLPGTCAVGDTFFDTDATAGKNIYGCTAVDTWTLQGDGVGDNRMTVNQATHGFSADQWIMHNDTLNAWELLDSSAVDLDNNAIGFVYAVADANNFTVTISGSESWTHGLDVGPLYASSTPGTLTDTAPALGTVEWLVAVASSSGAIVVMQREWIQL
jgi:hypothetical protein